VAQAQNMKKTAGTHTIPGIGAGFVPKALNINAYDEVFKVPGNNVVNLSSQSLIL